MILEHKGINIFYTDEGHGKTIVLLHGFLENSSIWHPFLKELTKHHRVICIDLLGHGQTDCMGYIHTMELMAENVFAVINYLKINTCYIAGHSMGGYVALAFIEAYPKIIHGILLVNSTSRKDNTEKKKNRTRAIAAVKYDHKTFIRIAIANLFNPENKEKFQINIKNITKEALKTPLQGIVAALEGMKIRKERTQLLERFKQKKMMIISKKDPVLDHNSLVLEAKTTNTEIIEFEDGHMSFIENEGLFFHKIMHFIEK